MSVVNYTFGLVERPGSTSWRVRHPPFLCLGGRVMKELSIFVDESGDFGEYDHRSPYYIITMVLHDQKVDINDDLMKFENELSHLGWSDHCIHTGSLIRAEDEYRDYKIIDRRKVLMKMMNFVRCIDFKYKSICLIKKHFNDPIEVACKLSKMLSVFIRDNAALLYSYDTVKVYYDNGQIEITRILSSVFNAMMENIEFKKVMPSEYRLFQIADLICMLKLIELKMDNNALSKSERIFFKDERTLRKNYIKAIKKKEL